MLQTTSYGKCLGLNIEVLGGHVTVHIAGAVACCQYDRAHELLLNACMIRFHADYLITLQYETGHKGLKMDLAAAVYDGVADVLDYAWQAVGAYVRVCIGQYRGAGAVLAEYVQYAVKKQILCFRAETLLDLL